MPLLPLQEQVAVHALPLLAMETSAAVVVALQVRWLLPMRQPALWVGECAAPQLWRLLVPVESTQQGA